MLTLIPFVALSAPCKVNIPQLRLSKFPVSTLADRARQEVPRIIANPHDPVDAETSAALRRLQDASLARMKPVLDLVASGPHDQALEAAKNFRRAHPEEFLLDALNVPIVRLLVELDREQEALTEMEQWEDLQLNMDNHRGLYVYLLGRAGRVSQVGLSKAQEMARSSGEYWVDAYKCVWMQAEVTPSAEHMVGLGWAVCSMTELTEVTKLRITRRAHASLPDEPNIKRALAKLEYRVSKDCEKALRLIREVMAVADTSHLRALRREEGQYAAAVRYRRDHGGG